jgi:hypothetical protein
MVPVLVPVLEVATVPPQLLVPADAVHEVALLDVQVSSADWPV